MKPAKKKMKKTTKAVTLLTRIEGMLSDVLKECSAIEKGLEKNVRALLRTAETSVEAARDYFVTPTPAKPVRKPAKRVAAKPKAKVKAKRRPVAKKHARPKVAPPRTVALAPFVPSAPEPLRP